MKKNLSLLVLLPLFLYSFPSFSQVRLGVEGGVNSSRFVHSGGDNNDNMLRIGYSAGVVAEKNISDAFSLQTGLSWTNKGYKFGFKGEIMNEPLEYKNNISANYLELPAYLAFTKRNFQVHAGPYLGVGVAGNVKYRNKGSHSNQELVEGKDNIKFRNTVSDSDYGNESVLFMSRFDYGLNFGIGYRAGPALVRATYSRGLANVFPKHEGEPNYGENKTYNKVLSLSVAWFFRD